VTVSDDVSTAASGGPERSGLDLYFVTGSGDTFMSTILYRPYFYVLLQQQRNNHSSSNSNSNSSPGDDVLLELLVSTMHRLYDAHGLHSCRITFKTDLDQPNHLARTTGRPMLKLTFDNVSQLMEVRNLIREIIAANLHRSDSKVASFDAASFGNSASAAAAAAAADPLGQLQDLREYDVPYTVRVCTDLNIRAGTWYTVELQDAANAATSIAGNNGGGGQHADMRMNDNDNDDDDNDNDNNDDATGKQPQEQHDTGGVRLVDPDHEQKANPTFFAFDIECTKAPLKFPQAEVDEIFMISYMVTTATGSQGYLIVSRTVVSQDIADFEYTPQPKYPGPFEIFNEVDEKALLERFFVEYQRHRPQIVVTYNGDFFDWPYVETRAKHYGLDMYKETGVQQVNDGEYRGRCSVHLDAFHWVQRDSYLPQGSQGLKAVTKYKLGYDPVEVDPEDMVKFAQERPVHMATYSVSDAVSTYYLYEKYVHSFIFSLCTIIPMGPEDVLRKGSGTLCETLLMVQACQKNIICPNKQMDPVANFHKGHLLESETYIGGKVECLETGVYRSDIEYEFDLKPKAFQQLIDNIDRDLTFAIEVEGGKDRKDVVNYDEVGTILWF
jgi:DNA polymerase epsilon subunit 1